MTTSDNESYVNSQKPKRLTVSHSRNTRDKIYSDNYSAFRRRVISRHHTQISITVKPVFSPVSLKTRREKAQTRAPATKKINQKSVPDAQFAALQAEYLRCHPLAKRKGGAKAA